MYRITYTRSKIDGTEMLDYVPELRTFGGTLFRFRSAQPGYIGINHGLTEDQLTAYVILEFQSEQDFNNCMANEANHEETSAARAALAAFCAEHGIQVNITYETI